MPPIQPTPSSHRAFAHAISAARDTFQLVSYYSLPDHTTAKCHLREDVPGRLSLVTP